MIDDRELLRRYADNRSEDAFGELVARHTDLVFSVALRLVGRDPHLAQDVVQTVFTDLARRAPSLRHVRVLPGWLCRHAFFVASSIVRHEQRRRNRERQAAEVSAPETNPGPDWDRLAPYLDEALQALGAAGRDALVLRFFQGRDLKSVAQALSTNEDAAQKRVTRALDRLHSRLTKRGVSLTTAAIATVLASQAVAAAPVGLAATVTGTVLSGSGTA